MEPPFIESLSKLMQTTSIDILEEQLQGIVSDVFSSMLQMHVSFSAEPMIMPPKLFRATIQFVGKSLGRLQIHLSLEQCFEVTSRLMRIDRPTAFNEDVSDALGELANMIGGNLKALLPERAELSLPTVYLPQPSGQAGSGGELPCTMAMTEEMGTFFITFEGSTENISTGVSPDAANLPEKSQY